MYEQRAAGAPLSFSPLSLSEVARRRATRLSGWPVEEGPAERSEVGGALGGTGPAQPGNGVIA
jgi:hypothetical protein